MTASPELSLVFDSIMTIDTPSLSHDERWDAYWAEDLDRIVRSMDAVGDEWSTRLDIE